jgi:hypothetical protein
MNTAYAMSAEDYGVERARLQAAAKQYLADHLPRPESFSERDALIDAGMTIDPTDEEIIGTIAATFDLSRAEAIDRLARIDCAAARERYMVPA